MSKNTALDETIDNLTGELDPVKRLKHPLLRVSPWFIFSLFYVGVILSYAGIRYDLSDKLTEPLYLMEVILSLFISITAAISSVYLAVPDMRGKKRLSFLPIAGFALFAIYYIYIILRDGFVMPYMEFHHCATDGLMMVGVPILVMLIMMRKGATTRPLMTAVNNVLSVGMLGWIGLRMSCVAEGAGHLFAYHFLPFIVLGVALAIFSRQLYKW